MNKFRPFKPELLNYRTRILMRGLSFDIQLENKTLIENAVFTMPNTEYADKEKLWSFEYNDPIDNNRIAAIPCTREDEIASIRPNGHSDYIEDINSEASKWYIADDHFPNLETLRGLSVDNNLVIPTSERNSDGSVCWNRDGCVWWSEETGFISQKLVTMVRYAKSEEEKQELKMEALHCTISLLKRENVLLKDKLERVEYRLAQLQEVMKTPLANPVIKGN